MFLSIFFSLEFGSFTTQNPFMESGFQVPNGTGVHAFYNLKDSYRLPSWDFNRKSCANMIEEDLCPFSNECMSLSIVAVGR